MSDCTRDRSENAARLCPAAFSRCTRFEGLGERGWRGTLRARLRDLGLTITRTVGPADEDG